MLLVLPLCRLVVALGGFQISQHVLFLLLLVLNRHYITAGFTFGNAGNAPIPAGTIGTVIRIDADGDVHVDFGAALNSDKMISSRNLDLIEADAVRTRVVSRPDILRAISMCGLA